VAGLGVELPSTLAHDLVGVGKDIVFGVPAEGSGLASAGFSEGADSAWLTATGVTAGGGELEIASTAVGGASGVEGVL